MKNEKILLVTGASSETGCGLIGQIADQYSAVWAHYHTSDGEIHRLRERFGEKILPVRADFSDPGAIEEMAAKILDSGKSPDHIVHLAAPKTFNLQFHKCGWKDFQEGMDVSLRPAVLLLERLIPGMCRRRYGRIVLMLTSYTLGGVPPRFQSPYITVKYALYGLMRTLASEYASKGITVNGVSPDMMETRFLSEIPRLVIEKHAADSPLGRNITVQDVAPAIAYLLSDQAQAVTGQNLGITGGGFSIMA